MATRSNSPQRAISLLVTWQGTDDPTGQAEFLTLLETLMREDDEDGLTGRLPQGLVTLAGWLSTRLAEATGQDINHVLQDMAVRAERYDAGEGRSSNG